MNNNSNEFNNMQNIEQNDYYNNDSYYSNDNYENNYSDTSYEEKEKKNGIWWKILLVILILLIIIFLLLKFCGDKSGKTPDEKYAELSAKICTAAESHIMNNPNLLDRTEPGKSVIIKYQALADANLIEAQIENPYYKGGLFDKDKGSKYYSMENSVRLVVMRDGSLNCELVDNASDVTAPELRLNGDAEIVLAVGTEFEDPGYTATDDYDGDITDRVVISGTYDFSKAGTYELTYTVQDAAGNVSTKKRKLVYEEYSDIEITLGSVLDTVTPQISLKGSNPYCMVKGTKYVEPGAVATDNVDGNITDRISVTNKVTGNLMGAFRVVYKVEDSSGNEAIAYRAVIVTTSCPEAEEPENVVNNAPTLSLVGKSAITVNIGSEYIDLGATAYDKEDGDITGRIVTDASGVNVNSAGVYKVIYRVTDSGGLTSSITRTVTVKQAVSGNPVVRFTGTKNNIEVYVGEGNNSLISAPKAVNENGVQVNVTTRIEDYTTKQVVSSIDWNKEGKYRVIFTATHGNGVLKQTKSIVVTIKNDKVTIAGKDAINVSLRKENCDLTEADLIKGGVTFEVNGSKTPIVEIANSKDVVCKIGSYEVEVSARVNDGEVTKKTIKVFVVNGADEEVNPNAPGKVVITANSANPNNVYNTNGVWVGGAVTGIELKFQAALPANSSISYFEWSSDCNIAEGKLSTTGANTSAMTWTTEGKNAVCVRAVSVNGIAGPWSSPVNLYIDRTGPSVEFTHTWKDGKDDWHNTSSLTLSYKANDAGSGLSHFEYTYDDVKAKKAEEIVTYAEATGNLIVSENTEPTRPELFVYVRAVDKSGNKGEWTVNPAFANMDTIKPNVPTLTVSGNNTSVVKLIATGTDNVNTITNRNSGVGKFEFDVIDSLNNLKDYYVNATKATDNPLKGTATFTMPVNGEEVDKTYNVKVWTVDKAGNKSEQSADETITVKPGRIVEEVKLVNGNTEIKEGDACQTSTLYVGKTITLTATPIPINALEKDVVWKVEDAEIATIDENGKVTAKKAGETTVTAKIGEVSKSCKLKVESQATPGTGGGGGGGNFPPACNVANCKTCSSANVCSACNDGYILSAGKCYKNNTQTCMSETEAHTAAASKCGINKYKVTQGSAAGCYVYTCNTNTQTCMSETEAHTAAASKCGINNYKVTQGSGAGCYVYTCNACMTESQAYTAANQACGANANNFTVSRTTGQCYTYSCKVTTTARYKQCTSTSTASFSNSTCFCQSGGASISNGTCSSNGVCTCSSGRPVSMCTAVKTWTTPTCTTVSSCTPSTSATKKVTCEAISR